VSPRQLAVLFLLLLAPAAAEDGCLEYFCQDLLENVCASLTNITHVALNENGCSSDTYCFAVTISVWSKSSGANDDALCIDGDAYFSSLETEYDCGTRKDVGTLISGEYPKLCETDEDCKLSDNNKAHCGCGMNGQAYCRPSVDDVTFDDFWIACGVEGKLINKVDVEYYTTLIKYYELFVDPAECAGDLFYENDMIKDYDTEDTATMLLVSAGLMAVMG
jgi:hypothetical protein